MLMVFGYVAPKVKQGYDRRKKRNGEDDLNKKSKENEQKKNRKTEKKQSEKQKPFPYRSNEEIIAIIKKRVKEAGAEFELKYSDEQLNAIIDKGKHLVLDEKTIEDFAITGSRNKKRIEFDELLKQMDNYISARDRGYPFLFESKEKFQEFTNILKQTLSKWKLINFTVKIQGSSVRKQIGINDLDIAIVVDESTFKVLVSKYSSEITSEKVLNRIGKNGKISGLDMFQSSANTPNSLTVDLYKGMEKKFGKSFTEILKVEKLQVSIIKENAPFDLGPCLIVN